MATKLPNIDIVDGTCVWSALDKFRRAFDKKFDFRYDVLKRIFGDIRQEFDFGESYGSIVHLGVDTQAELNDNPIIEVIEGAGFETRLTDWRNLGQCQSGRWVDKKTISFGPQIAYNLGTLQNMHEPSVLVFSHHYDVALMLNRLAQANETAIVGQVYFEELADDRLTREANLGRKDFNVDLFPLTHEDKMDLLGLTSTRQHDSYA